MNELLEAALDTGKSTVTDKCVRNKCNDSGKANEHCVAENGEVTIAKRAMLTRVNVGDDTKCALVKRWLTKRSELSRLISLGVVEEVCDES